MAGSAYYFELIGTSPLITALYFPDYFGIQDFLFRPYAGGVWGDEVWLDAFTWYQFEDGIQGFMILGAGPDGSFTDFPDNLLFDAKFSSVGDVVARVAVLPLQQTGAIPEPATWLTLIVGFGACGIALRRRKLHSEQEI